MAEEFKTVKTVLEEWGWDLVDDLGTSLPRDSDASGDLRKSIKFNIKYFGNVYTFELLMEDYWKNLEYGQPPGTVVKVGRLMRWASEKKLAIRNDTKRLGTKRNTKKDVLLGNKELKSFAFAVKHTIFKKGTKPQPFYEKVATPERIKDLSRRFSIALKRDVEIEIQSWQ